MLINCLCILDNIFKFTLSFKEDYFIFNDQSNWGIESKEIANTKVKVKVKSDCYEKDIYIFPGQATILSYDNLITLPDKCGIDGIYEFEITTCNNTQILAVNYYILKNIECAYSKLVIKEDWDNALFLLKKIELIKANAFFCDFNTAKEHYELAVRFIKKLNCNCN